MTTRGKITVICMSQHGELRVVWIAKTKETRAARARRVFEGLSRSSQPPLYFSFRHGGAWHVYKLAVARGRRLAPGPAVHVPTRAAAEMGMLHRTNKHERA